MRKFLFILLLIPAISYAQEFTPFNKQATEKDVNKFLNGIGEVFHEYTMNKDVTFKEVEIYPELKGFFARHNKQTVMITVSEFVKDKSIVFYSDGKSKPDAYTVDWDSSGIEGHCMIKAYFLDICVNKESLKLKMAMITPYNNPTSF